MAKNVTRIDSVESLEAKLAEMRKAQAVFRRHILHAGEVIDTVLNA